MNNNLSWYQMLNKPLITPPSWVFTAVWTTLYFLMAVSLLLYLKRPSAYSKKLPLITFFTQLVLSFLWPYVFFTMENLTLSAAICVIMVILVLIVMQQFYRVSKGSTYLLIPYILWLCLATYLNIELIRLN